MTDIESSGTPAEETARRPLGRVHTVVSGPGAGSRAGARTVVELHGEIDVATARRLALHLDAATAGDRPRVVVDLRGVRFIDSAGLRPICRAWCRARDRGGEVTLVCTDPRVLRTLRLAGLTPTMSVSAARGAVRLGRLPAFRAPGPQAPGLRTSGLRTSGPRAAGRDPGPLREHGGS